MIPLTSSIGFNFVSTYSHRLFLSVGSGLMLGMPTHFCAAANSASLGLVNGILQVVGI